MAFVANSLHYVNGGLNGHGGNPPSKHGDATNAILIGNLKHSEDIKHSDSHSSESTTENGSSCGENGMEELSQQAEEEAPTIDIIINNVVCTFSTKCHLNLKKIAMEGVHVEYKRQNGMLNMKLRRPNATATIWSSGKITCTGSTSEDEAKLAARRIARRLQRLGFNIRFSNFRVVNVLGTCAFPFCIRLNPFSAANMEHASYEPELHPGVTYKIKEPRATLKIFSTGSITVTAPCVLNVQLAIEHIYPLVQPYKMEKAQIDKRLLLAERKYMRKGGVFIHNPVMHLGNEEEEEEYFDEDELDDDHESDISDDFDSDSSQD